MIRTKLSLMIGVIAGIAGSMGFHAPMTSSWGPTRKPSVNDDQLISAAAAKRARKQAKRIKEMAR